MLNLWGEQWLHDYYGMHEKYEGCEGGADQHFEYESVVCFVATLQEMESESETF